jgi:mono/diheme cytochrome c family protein
MVFSFDPITRRAIVRHASDEAQQLFALRKRRFCAIGVLLMRPAVGFVALFVVCAGWAAQSQTERSVWDRVYTEGQAARGQKVFESVCAACHTIDDFSGTTFTGTWGGSTSLDLFQKIQTTMPMDQPGSLAPQEYIDVVSYFFRVNEFPAGDTELDTDAEHLKAIRIQAKKE